MLRPDLDLEDEEEEELEDGQVRMRKMKARSRQISQAKPTQMNKALTAMWRKKKRRARQQLAALGRKGAQTGFNLKQARSVLEKKGLMEQGRKGVVTRSRRDAAEPAMPILEAEDDGEEGEIDLETIYKYGSQMREFEERKRREKENWEKVQEELKQGKEGRSMVIVLKSEEGLVEVEVPSKETPKKEVTKKEDAKPKREKDSKKDAQGQGDAPVLHVIEPILAGSHDGPEHWEYPDRDQEQATDEDQSTQVIYIHRHSKHGVEEEEEDLEEGKKFFKRRRDKGTRVAKGEPKSKKPLWQQEVMKKGLKLEVEKPSGPISCRYCPRNFKDHSYLFRHVKSHHMDNTEVQEYLDDIRPKMKVNCPICEKSISSLANVANHMKQCHPNTSTEVACDHCGKVYKTPASLKQHIRQRHSVTVRKFECSQCDQVFSERRGLTDHINCVHETTQVFTCNKCWKVFLTKSRLRRHTYIHGEHRHICKFCGKGFHIKDNMNKHIRIVHEKNNGKMWKCSYCSKEFLVKGNMTQHIRGIHLKQFPFTCSKCQQGFRRMRDMMLHMERCNEENVSIEMFENESKSETPKGSKRRASRSKGQGTGGPRRSRSKRDVTPDSEEDEDDDLDEEYVIQDQMIVTAEDEDDIDEDEEEDYEEDEDDLEETMEGEVSAEYNPEVSQNNEETREVIINSNFTQDPNDPMKLHIEQDGVVIPIEVVIGQNEAETDGFEVIADGAQA